MKKLSTAILALVLLATSCRKIEEDGNNSGTTTVSDDYILKGRIDTDKTLKSGKTYKLRDIVYIVNGAKLNIEPGVTIIGEKSTRGTLVITRGCQIIADASATQPIVFTSDAVTPARGDWGGIVICGRAKTNNSFNGTVGVGEVEGGVNNSDGLGLYGGADDNDNSGILRYVRIEYAGYAYLPDKELNGLTLCGVGRGTTVDYVQVAYANDDSFEWFGGTVNCKHLIAYKGLDDDFDCDNGFSGNVQFGIAMRDSNIADISGSNGFEIDNDANGSALLPQTSAVFSNITIIGPRATLSNIGNSNFKRGVHLRRNCALSIFNSIVMGYPVGLLIDASTGTPTDLNITATTPKLVLANNILAGNTIQFGYAANTAAPTGWNVTSVTDYFNRTNGGNEVFTTASEVGLTAPFDYSSAVDFNPTATSPAMSGAAFSQVKLTQTFFSTVSYRGACAVGDTWWKGWTKY
jgi:hypothetical protein